MSKSTSPHDLRGTLGSTRGRGVKQPATHSITRWSKRKKRPNASRARQKDLAAWRMCPITLQWQVTDTSQGRKTHCLAARGAGRQPTGAAATSACGEQRHSAEARRITEGAPGQDILRDARCRRVPAPQRRTTSSSTSTARTGLEFGGSRPNTGPLSPGALGSPPPLLVTATSGHNPLVSMIPPHSRLDNLTLG